MWSSFMWLNSASVGDQLYPGGCTSLPHTAWSWAGTEIRAVCLLDWLSFFYNYVYVCVYVGVHHECVHVQVWVCVCVCARSRYKVKYCLQPAENAVYISRRYPFLVTWLWKQALLLTFPKIPGKNFGIFWGWNSWIMTWTLSTEHIPPFHQHHLCLVCHHKLEPC